MRQSFFDEEILDRQFIQLEKLEDRENPNFVEEVLTLYFRDSTTLLATIEREMENVPIDFPKVDRILHQLKGSSASIGANKVRNEITKTRELWQQGNREGAKATFQEARKEHDTLKAKLEPYFQQLRQAGPAETAMRPR
ncbi:pseudo histidine-containing phosphotransfer protein 5-like isoform X2 [Durio zibethinus]|nr:pseudo histidine-containing phosphotransfer protein 5-like isoform X2 [Durio zibethinus]